MIPKRHVAADLGGGFEVRKQADPAVVPNLPDLKLEQGGLLPLIKAARVLCNAWALCGADLVDHPTEKGDDGNPKRVRNIHLAQAQRYNDFLFEKALEFGPNKREVVTWVMDRGRQTRDQARTMYAKGLPWGDCLVACIETSRRFIWEISGVGIQDKVSLVRRQRQEDLYDADEPPKRGGGKGGRSKGRLSAEKRPPPTKTGKVDKRLQLISEKVCPDDNSQTGCARKQADCPHGLWHCCSKCGRRGHSALNCKLVG